MYPSVYAIGDLNGLLPLAHVASAQGILAVEHLSGQETKPLMLTTLPTWNLYHAAGGFLWLSEAKALETRTGSEVGQFPFLPNWQGAGLGENAGFVKVVLKLRERLAPAVKLALFIVVTRGDRALARAVLAHTAGLSPTLSLLTVHAHPTPQTRAVMSCARCIWIRQSISDELEIEGGSG
jgi:dihydrolipoamide dehydrogenase